MVVAGLVEVKQRYTHAQNRGLKDNVNWAERKVAHGFKRGYK